MRLRGSCKFVSGRARMTSSCQKGVVGVGRNTSGFGAFAITEVTRTLLQKLCTPGYDPAFMFGQHKETPVDVHLLQHVLNSIEAASVDSASDETVSVRDMASVGWGFRAESGRRRCSHVPKPQVHPAEEMPWCPADAVQALAG